MQDADYEKLVVTPCDVKGIQNTPSGVCDFWIKALLNHPLGQMISEKDRPILGYLHNIELELHPEDEGFDLIFTFQENSYFNGTTLKKQLFMKSKGMLEKSIGTKIEWKDGCDPTRKKTKKKRKGKKVTVEVEAESFFNIFKDLDPEKESSKNKPTPKDDEDELEEEDEIMQKLQDELDVADQIKDDLVPLALEYYLGVIEIEDQDDDSDGSEDDDSGDDKPKKKKKGGKN